MSEIKNTNEQPISSPEDLIEAVREGLKVPGKGRFELHTMTSLQELPEGLSVGKNLDLKSCRGT